MRDEQWLMLYRNQKKNDVNTGKWIGVGGKKEPGETFEECAVREVKEETGFSIQNLSYCGEVYFYQDNILTEYIRIYQCNEFTGEMISCDEGTLKWISKNQLMNLSLWDGDRIFMKEMLEGKSEVFSLRLYYDADGELMRVG